jgi:hypothetical protein
MKHPFFGKRQNLSENRALARLADSVIFTDSKQCIDAGIWAYQSGDPKGANSMETIKVEIYADYA